jgi:hypothetical protein
VASALSELFFTIIIKGEKIMMRIISFFLSLIFSIDLFLAGFFPEKQIVIEQRETETEYYINGESDSLRFGVVGDGNLFAPDEEICVVI